MKNEKIIRRRDGSALLLAVVLTSLLAIVGVMFLMFARVEKISTSAVTANKELNLAVDTVIAKISQQLALDVPGVPNQEYYDYPDPNYRNNIDPWLANLEPYEAGVKNYHWRHISDLYENLGPDSFNLQATIIPDYNQNISPIAAADADGDGVADSRWIILPDMTSSKGKPIFAAIRIVDNGGMLNVNTAYKFDPSAADANKIDGSSLMQINLAALSQRGANGTLAVAANKLQAWRNLNNLPGYEPNVIWNYYEPKDKYTPFDISDELKLRYRYLLNDDSNATRIEKLWTKSAYDNRNYDISVPRSTANSIKDANDWFYYANYYSAIPDNYKRYDYRHISTIHNIDRVIKPDGIKMLNVNQAAGAKDADSIRNAIRESLLDLGLGFSQADVNATQIAVNLVDFIDNDNDAVTTLKDVYGTTHYGFERPCIYISELAQSFYDPCDVFNPNNPNSINDPNIYRSYGIELHKPYFEDSFPRNDWRIVIGSKLPIDVNWTGSDQYHVIAFEDANAPLGINFAPVIDLNFPYPPNGAKRIDPNADLYWPKAAGANFYDVYFGTDFNSVRDANKPNILPGRGRQDANDRDYELGTMVVDVNYYWRIDYVTASSIHEGDIWSFRVGKPIPQVNDVNFTIGAEPIQLQRFVPDIGGYISVDVVRAPVIDVNWVQPDPTTHKATHSLQRDITRHKCIRRLWDDRGIYPAPTLGWPNNFALAEPVPTYIQAHPENKPFTNIGEIGMLFRKRAYYNIGEDPLIPGSGVIGFDPYSSNEKDVRVDLANLNYQQLFKYLTVFDPNVRSNETRIKGRININTAPWYVIAQLPWVSQRKDGFNSGLAQAIVAYRDKTPTVDPNGPDYSARPGLPGFRSIGELDNVYAAALKYRNYSIDYYARDGADLAGFPDLTPGGILGDGAPNDFEERDVIFSRISNLVTVRSDVFTAYILIRIGVDGPQKRVVAILDRSEAPTGKVKVIAVQQTPEPR